LGATVEINLHCPALLPNAYCPDVHERLTLYKRLASAQVNEELDSLQEELIDRFGKLPEPATALLSTHRLRIMAKPMGILKVDASAEGATIQFDKNPSIDPGKIIALIQKHKHIKLAGQDKLKIIQSTPTVAQKVQCVKDLLKQLN
jgi:transcription-repair coupling factor (superfamily II helicase)